MSIFLATKVAGASQTTPALPLWELAMQRHKGWHGRVVRSDIWSMKGMRLSPVLPPARSGLRMKRR